MEDISYQELKNMNPVIVSIEEGIPKKKRKEFIGKTVNECLKQLPGKNIDAIVKIAFKRESF